MYIPHQVFHTNRCCLLVTGTLCITRRHATGILWKPLWSKSKYRKVRARSVRFALRSITPVLVYTGVRVYTAETTCRYCSSSSSRVRLSNSGGRGLRLPYADIGPRGIRALSFGKVVFFVFKSFRFICRARGKNCTTIDRRTAVTTIYARFAEHSSGGNGW